MTFAFANILTAFDESTIGSKVGNPTAFLAALETAVANHDESRDRAPGQHFVVMSMEDAAAGEVTCGIGHRTPNPADFVLRNHRGNVNPFLRRDCALPVTFLATIVYTREAYLADPDVIASSETIADDATHVVVAVLASAEGVPNPLPRGTYRLAHCLAGGNKEADAWTLAEVKQMCTDSVAYEDTFCVVAD
jgi:hypothetical protein|tara:strand:- start:2643 stop:3218 length:576 start_codon:yes stop_codon:yes gene_type:complete